MNAEFPEENTAANLIFDLWRKCMATSREAGVAPAEAVQTLIRKSREILAEKGCSQNDAEGILFDIYNVIHWECHHPTDKVFETLLDFELTEYFNERGIGNESTNIS